MASPDDWRSVLESVSARYHDAAVARRFFRGDAAFAMLDL